MHLLAALPENSVFQSLLGDWGRYPTLANVFGWLAIPCGAVGLYYMYRCYRIPARPFWDHWQTGSSFAGTSLVSGGLLLGLIGVPTLLWLAQPADSLIVLCAALVCVGTVLEAVGLWRHAIDMNFGNNEGSASHYVQCTVFGKSYALRNALLGLNLALSLALLSGVFGAWAVLPLALLLAVSALTVALIGRALFYVLVIPTTMPGAFFWKNKDFEEHAREIGLAHMPQVGVVYHNH